MTVDPPEVALTVVEWLSCSVLGSVAEATVCFAGAEKAVSMGSSALSVCSSIASAAFARMADDVNDGRGGTMSAYNGAFMWSDVLLAPCIVTAR